MRDIYHLLTRTDYKELSTNDLEQASDTYDTAAMAINCALSLIGNLVLEAEASDAYSGDEAKRDLYLTGIALRHLPRLYQALSFNADLARHEHTERESKGGRG